MFIRLATLFFLGTVLVCSSWSRDDSITVEAHDDQELFSLGAALMKNIATDSSSPSDIITIKSNATLRQYSANSIKQVDTIMFQPFCNRELFTTAIGVCDAIFPPLPCPCPQCPKCPICPKCPTCPPGVSSNTTNYWCVDSGATSPSGRLLFNASLIPATASTACNFVLWVKANSSITLTCTKLSGSVSITTKPLSWPRPNNPFEAPLNTTTPHVFNYTGAILSSNNARPTTLECSWSSIEIPLLKK